MVGNTSRPLRRRFAQNGALAALIAGFGAVVATHIISANSSRSSHSGLPFVSGSDLLLSRQAVLSKRDSSPVACGNAAKRQRTVPDEKLRKMKHNRWIMEWDQRWKQLLPPKFAHWMQGIEREKSPDKWPFTQSLIIHWPEGGDEAATEDEVMAHFTTDDYKPDAVRVRVRGPWTMHRKAYVHFPTIQMALAAMEAQEEGSIASTDYHAQLVNEKTWICVRDGVRPTTRMFAWERTKHHKAYGNQRYPEMDNGYYGGKHMYFNTEDTWAPLGSRSNHWYPDEKPTNQPTYTYGNEKADQAWYDGEVVEWDPETGKMPWPTVVDDKGKPEEVIQSFGKGIQGAKKYSDWKPVDYWTKKLTEKR